jgi:hypothetical protein
MANTIITKNSATATAVPTAGQLVQGELAVNVTDKRLFTENSGGTVVEVGTNPSTIAVAGNATVGGTLGVTGLATLASSTLTANPTLSAGTANGVTYLNGSKVLTSGSALTTNGSSLGVGSSDFGGAGSINVSVGVAGTTTGGLQLWSTTTGQHYVQFGDGTAGAATYAGAIGYSHATDQMFFYANGTEAMRLTSTGLGIGTSSPAYKLHAVRSGNGIVGRFDTTSDGITDVYGYGLEITRSIAYIKGSGALHLGSAAGYSAAVLDSSGNLGLGVTPSAWWSSQRTFQIGRSSSVSSRTDIGLIDINDNNYTDAATNVIYIADGAASKYRQNSGSHQWLTAPSGTAGNAISFTQAMTLTADGNLGVGTSSPATDARLNVVGGYARIENTVNTTISGSYVWDSTDRGIILFNRSNTTNTAVGLTMFGGTSANSVGAIYMVQETGNNAGALAFYTGGASKGSPYAFERARITSGGDFLVGTTSSLGSKLSVNAEMSLGTDGNNRGILGYSSGGISFGTINASTTYFDSMTLKDGNLLVGTTSATPAGITAHKIVVERSSTVYGVAVGYSIDSAPRTQMSFYNSNGVVGIISTSGSATTYATSSDYRLKEDWVAVADASTRVNALKPVNFAWKVDGTRVDGFLAHELAEVVPEAVTGEKDAVDAEGNPVYQGIDQSKLVPLLTAALQEALAKIDSLTARVSALEGN